MGLPDAHHAVYRPASECPMVPGSLKVTYMTHTFLLENLPVASEFLTL